MRKHPQPFFRAERNLWYVQIKGRQHNLGPDKEQAFQRYHSLMGKAHTGTSDQTLTRSGSDSPLVLEIIEIFLSWCKKHKAPRTYDWYVFKTSAFARSIPRELTFAELKPFHVQDWVDGNPKWAPGQKRACITAVQRVFNWAVRQGRIPSTPLRGLEKPEEGKRDTILSTEQFQQLLSLVEAPAARDLFIAAWETGCRPQEIFAVESRHVDLVNACWVFPKAEAKGKKKVRVVYLTAAALEITQRMMAANPQGPIFCNSKGEPWNKSSSACVFARLQIAEHEVGRRVLALKNEREGLLDCVWLACSSKQIKDLWGKVAKLLSDEQTQLQREALTIAPVEE